LPGLPFLNRLCADIARPWRSPGRGDRNGASPVPWGEPVTAGKTVTAKSTLGWIRCSDHPSQEGRPHARTAGLLPALERWLRRPDSRDVSSPPTRLMLCSRVDYGLGRHSQATRVDGPSAGLDSGHGVSRAGNPCGEDRFLSVGHIDIAWNRQRSRFRVPQLAKGASPVIRELRAACERNDRHRGRQSAFWN
jgi:hypothetical protein